MKIRVREVKRTRARRLIRTMCLRRVLDIPVVRAGALVDALASHMRNGEGVAARARWSAWPYHVARAHLLGTVAALMLPDERRSGHQREERNHPAGASFPTRRGVGGGAGRYDRK